MYNTRYTFKWKSLIAPLFLLVVVAVGIVYVKDPTELRKKAAINGAELSMSPSNTTQTVGTGFPVGIILNGGATDSVTAVELHFAYDPNLVNIKGFTVGKQLPVVLSQGAVVADGDYSITLGAQPNAPFRGADIIGTLNVNVKSNLPAAITFSKLTKVAALEKPNNTLVTSTGITINKTASVACIPLPSCAFPASAGAATCKIAENPAEGGVWCPKDVPPTGCYFKQVQCIQAPCDPIVVCPTSATTCTGGNGTTCTLGACPTCTADGKCPAMACKVATGICMNGICNRPVVCDNTNNGAGCVRCKPCPAGKICPMVCEQIAGTCQNGQCGELACTPRPRCLTGTEFPDCAYAGAPAPLPPGGYYCPITPTPTPTPHNWCAGPNGASCVYDCNTCNSAGCTRMKCISQGTCTNNLCTPLPTPTPYTQTGCVRSGCSGEICGSVAAGGLNSACVYKPVYACYKNARCEKQSNGVCAFTQTTELQSCLNTYITPTPTPPVGCHYQQVQCFQAPCNPILVCTSTTPTPTGCIQRLPCTVGANGVEVCTQTLAPGNWYCTTPTPTPVIPSVQTIDIRMKLAGVTDGSAEGAKVNIKFVKLGGETVQLSTALPITHIGSGVYKAVADITNPFASGTKFTIKIKGEKHSSVQFCKQVGQTGPCADNEFITVPSPVPHGYGFDLTGNPLPPGDVKVQDGKVDVADFAKIKSLMLKLCSSLTVEDKLIGDLDYNGCVNVRDVFLIRQTLETRYDE